MLSGREGRGRAKVKLKPELTAIDESVGMILPEEALERLGVDRGDTRLLVEEKGGLPDCSV